MSLRSPRRACLGRASLRDGWRACTPRALVQPSLSRCGGARYRHRWGRRRCHPRSPCRNPGRRTARLVPRRADAAWRVRPEGRAARCTGGGDGCSARRAQPRSRTGRARVGNATAPRARPQRGLGPARSPRHRPEPSRGQHLSSWLPHRRRMGAGRAPASATRTTPSSTAVVVAVVNPRRSRRHPHTPRPRPGPPDDCSRPRPDRRRLTPPAGHPAFDAARCRCVCEV